MSDKRNKVRVKNLILSTLATLSLVRIVGKRLNNRVCEAGINESMYIDVNGTKQWIHIYGEDKENPVLLYLHGGPGASTSYIDYAFTRKWADVYTVVTWDQRNCGKSYDDKQKDISLTKNLFLQDGKEVTEFILKYLSKEKITILGHSWGSMYGANLVLAYPEYYECFIGVGQLVDSLENEKAFKQEALLWAKGDEDTLALVNTLTPDCMTKEHITARNAIMKKYGYDMMANGSDYNLFMTVLCNPNYSITDWIQYVKRDMGAYFDFFTSEEFLLFSLIGRYDYQVPFYNVNGDKDYQTNYKLAQTYFEKVHAPYKQLFIMENMTHGLLESDSEGFSKILHRIVEIEKNRKNI